jgi:membrane dipeptidase
MSITIIDGHNDSLLRLERGGDHFPFLVGDEGHVDLPRAREGGMGGGFFACYVPRSLREPDPDEVTTHYDHGGYETTLADPLDPEFARAVTVSMARKLFRLEEDSEGELMVVRSTQDLVHCLEEDVFATILHFEGAEAIDQDLDALEDFYADGLRSLGIVWSRPNLFGHGVQFKFPSSPDTGPGLTWAGRQLVRACNDLGIMVDVSHLTEQGFWDVANISRMPIVATHSNAHALCPSSRNLTDDMLEAIKDSNGLAGISFCVCDVRSDGDDDTDTSIEELLNHVEYIAERIGIDHVAFGSDFDGAMVPDEVGDAAGYSRLLEGLEERGFSDDDLAKVAHGNWLRVLSDTWED